MFIQIQDAIYNINYIKQVNISHFDPRCIELIVASPEGTIHRYKTADEAKQAFKEIVKQLHSKAYQQNIRR
jgi:ABC-type metal ion transport system substrate-binding protein